MATTKTDATPFPGIRFDSDGNPLIETDEGWVRVKAKYPYHPPKKVEAPAPPSLPPDIRIENGQTLFLTDFGWQPAIGMFVLCLYERADKKRVWGDGTICEASGDHLSIKVSRPSPLGDMIVKTTVSNSATWKRRFPYLPKCGKPITHCGKPAGHSGECTPAEEKKREWHQPNPPRTIQRTETETETKTVDVTVNATEIGEKKTETKRERHKRTRTKSKTKTST